MIENVFVLMNHYQVEELEAVIAESQDIKEIVQLEEQLQCATEQIDELKKQVKEATSWSDKVMKDSKLAKGHEKN